MKTTKITFTRFGKVSLDDPIKEAKEAVLKHLKRTIKKHTKVTVLKIDMKIETGFKHDDFQRYRKTYKANVAIYLKRPNRSR